MEDMASNRCEFGKSVQHRLAQVFEHHLLLAHAEWRHLLVIAHDDDLPAPCRAG